VGFEEVTAIVIKSSTFSGITSDSTSNVNRHFTLATAYFMLDFSLVYSSALKMEATCSYETSADFQKTTRRYISDDETLQINT
jgi:hypothetical protein